MADGPSVEIVFPQDQGGEDWTGAQIALQELETQAAEIRAIQPSVTVYLGVIGCLIYKSTAGDDTYVTGFVGDLHLANGGRSKPGRYVPVYDTLIAGNGPVNIKMKVKTLGAWAD